MIMAKVASNTSDREIVITRTVNAPRELVWSVWTDPAHLARWWGPNGFSITTHDFDFRKGGEWNFMMHGPDGRDYPNKIVFTEIVEPERMCHDHGGDDGKVQFQAVITFEAQGDRTLVTMRSIFPSAAALEHVVKEYGAIEGGKQTLGRLAEYAENMSQ